MKRWLALGALVLLYEAFALVFRALDQGLIGPSGVRFVVLGVGVSVLALRLVVLFVVPALAVYFAVSRAWERTRM